MRADNFLPSLGVMFLGMAIVFFGLVILIVFTKLLTKMMGRESKPARQPKPKAPKPAPAEAPAEDPLLAAGEDPQLIAVITAALMAMQQGGKRLVVRSVRRTDRWGSAGRGESINY